MTIYGQGQQYSGYQASPSYTPATGSSRGAGGTGSASYENTSSLEEGGGTDSVNLSAANQALIMADDNRDGVVDQQELANASYQLLSNENASDSDIAVGNLFATMVLGGQDGEGLFPDINQDGGITANELALLARGDDDTESISSEDFSLAYGDEVNPEGDSFTLEDLEAVATGQTPGSAGQEQGGQSDVTDSLVSIIGSLAELLVAQGGAAQTPAAAPAQTPAAAPAQPPAAAPAQAPAAAPAQTPATGGTDSPIAAIISIITSILTLITSLFSGQQGGQASQ